MTDSTGGDPEVLSGVVLFSSGILSSVLDNVVVVSSYMPVVKSLGELEVTLTPVWWALLFGACYEGNITMIGSTANIVALGLLEKEQSSQITFFTWFRIGILVGLLSLTISYLVLIYFPWYFK